MSTTTIDESLLIRERMHRLRGRLDDRASQLVTSTEELLDWKTYARRHPIALVAAGLLTGLVIAPAMKSRKRKSPILVTVQGNHDEAVLGHVDNVAPIRSAGFVSGFLQGTVSPMVKQFLWSYAKGMAVVHLDSLLKGVNAHSTEAAKAAQHQSDEATS